MADDHTRRSLDWIDAVEADLSVSAMAFRLAHVLKRHDNRKLGYSWLSQATLATALGTTDRTIRRLTDELVEAGHLKVVGAGGRHKSNHYYLVHKTRTPVSAFVGAKPGRPRPRFEPQTRTSVSANPDIRVQKPGRPCPTNPLIEPIEEPIESISAKTDDLFEGEQDAKPRSKNGPAKSAKAASNSAFEEWWTQYPKRVAKDAARRAFNAVIAKRKATAIELTAGAMRYATERHGQDEKFTKHAATWLNGGCWADAPQRQSIAPATPIPASQGGAASAWAGIFSARGDNDE